MALRFDLKDKDFKLDLHENILGALENVMRSNGAKVDKRKPRKKLIRDTPKNSKQNSKQGEITFEELLRVHRQAGTIVTNG